MFRLTLQRLGAVPPWALWYILGISPTAAVYLAVLRGSWEWAWKVTVANDLAYFGGLLAGPVLCGCLFRGAVAVFRLMRPSYRSCISRWLGISLRWGTLLTLACGMLAVVAVLAWVSLVLLGTVGVESRPTAIRTGLAFAAAAQTCMSVALWAPFCAAGYLLIKKNTE